MKVLLHHFTPFSLAHGDQQIQIERTHAELQQLGVEVDYLRWYDGTQKGDILHFFGRIPTSLLLKAQDKGMKVVMADLLGAQAARTPARLAVQKTLMRGIQAALPRLATIHFDWTSYRLADACVVVTRPEAELLTNLFSVPPTQVHVVPNGVEDIFLNRAPGKPGPWLVCVAAITETTRVVELARAAVRAQTPVWFIGKLRAESDPYGRSFMELAKANPQIIRYEGAVADREKLALIYREARGFVLLSTTESISLSALEAAACGCPLLLSDLPWVRDTFGEQSQYCPVGGPAEAAAAVLRRFYDTAPNAPAPPRPASWEDVARQLKSLYQSL